MEFEMSEYTTGFDCELRPTYDKQVRDGVRDKYIWEYKIEKNDWAACSGGRGEQVEPCWGFGNFYRFKLEDVDPKDKLIADQTKKIADLEERIDELRDDYKKMVEGYMGLIIDLAPTLSVDKLRMVGGRTGNWFVVME
jgi:hypothetical protein